MNLQIEQHTYNSTGKNIRTYITEDDDIIIDFLEAYYDKKEDIHTFLNDIDKTMVCVGNDMSLQYEDRTDNEVKYKIWFTNDKGIITTIDI